MPTQHTEYYLNTIYFVIIYILQITNKYEKQQKELQIVCSVIFHFFLFCKTKSYTLKKGKTAGTEHTTGMTSSSACPRLSS